MHACGAVWQVRGTVNLFEAATEADVFAVLGLEFVEPSKRNTEVAPIGGLPMRLQG